MLQLGEAFERREFADLRVAEIEGLQSGQVSEFAPLENLTALERIDIDTDKAESLAAALSNAKMEKGSLGGSTIIRLPHPDAR